MKKYVFEVGVDGWPVLHGPYFDNETQKAVGRALMAAGRQVFWLDSMSEVGVGRIAKVEEVLVEPKPKAKRDDMNGNPPHEGELLGEYRRRLGKPGADTGAAQIVRWHNGSWTRIKEV